LDRADRRSPIAAGIAVASGLALGLAWALVCPWLASVAASMAWVRLLCGVLAGAGVAGVAPRGVLGSAGAARLALLLAAAGTVGGLLGAVASAATIGATPSLALGLSATGVAVLVAVGAAAIAFAVDHRRHPTADAVDAPGVPLRPLVAGVCSALAIAAWALASGYLLGQRDRDARQHAVQEARDLAAIGAERWRAGPHRPSDVAALATALTPPSGLFVTVDEAGVVAAGLGAPPGATVELTEGPPTLCRIGEHTLPCAEEPLDGHARLLAAVPTPGGGGIAAFLLAGLAVAASALALGALLGASSGRDLDRVTQAVDDLRRTAKGQRSLDLDRPIVVGSLDEVGVLAASLGRLRAQLQPMIAEYRRALERSQAADRARDEFLQLVSIELRSPLDRIISGAKALIDDTADPLTPEQREDVRTVLTASNNLTELIDEVLDISAIATGQVVLRLGTVDVGALVSDVAKIQRPIVQKKGVEVKLAVAEPSPVVRADERRMRQVITNIVSNAVKFTDHGSIELTVSFRDGRVTVSVKDTGPGIAADALPKLFREFVQLGSIKQRAHGTGLGLAICKRLVEAHGGAVSAQSTLGVGSIFVVELPVAGPPRETSITDDTPIQAVGP
jgi:signal transduction histidine kinase